MTQKEYLAKIKAGYLANVAISEKKSSDYAGTDDPFKNFRGCEMYGISLEQGILVRMTDKMARIANLLDKKAKVKDESISDTLSDLCNYAMILKVYLDSKNHR